MRDLAWWESAFLAVAVAFLAFHLALAVAGVSPDEFVRYVGSHLLPDLSGL
ncbi:MAG: hypothetical protein U0667_15390 [Chloroflexota bacterium]